MADFTIHPKAATTIKAAEVAEHLLKMAAWRGRVHEGFTLTTASNSLNVTVATGRAYIMGREVGEPTVDTSVTKALTGFATNHIYLDDTGNVIVNTTGVAPANSIKLWEVTTNASGVTGTTDRREFSAGHDVALKAQSLEADGADAYVRGHRVHLKKAQPEAKWEDTSDGVVTVLRATGGKLRVIDVNTGTQVETVKLDDLRNLESSLSAYQLRGEKGQASGYPSLDAGGLVPRTQLPAATAAGQGAVELADAGVPAETPKTLASAGAVGASAVAARADHEHPHGDRSGDAGVTHHGMPQISGVVTDTQHGARGGGALHPTATGTQHGFMSSGDKSKLDGAASAPTPGTLMQRDGSGRAKVASPAASDDIAHKQTVDDHAALTTAHGSTPSAAAGAVMQRDAAGRAKVAAPSAADDIARKDTVDTVQTNLNNHKAAGGAEHPTATQATAGFMSAGDKAKLDGATPGNTGNALVQRNGSGQVAVGAPSVGDHATTKDYVDPLFGTLKAVFTMGSEIPTVPSAISRTYQYSWGGAVGPSGNNIVALYFDQNNSPYKIFCVRSTDGGRTWSEVDTGGPELNGSRLSETPFQVVALNDNTFYAVSPSFQRKWDGTTFYYDVTFLKTTDAGQTWTHTRVTGTNNNSYPPGYYPNIQVIDANNVLVSMWNHSSSSYPRGLHVYKSTNGGSSWSTITGSQDSVLTSGNSYYTNHKLVASDMNTVCIIAGPSGLFMWRTTDGGSNWSFKDLRSSTDNPSTYAQFQNWNYYGDSYGVATYRAANGYLYWSMVRYVAADAYELVIAKSTDTGATWSVIYDRKMSVNNGGYPSIWADGNRVYVSHWDFTNYDLLVTWADDAATWVTDTLEQTNNVGYWTHIKTSDGNKFWIFHMQDQNRARIFKTPRLRFY